MFIKRKWTNWNIKYVFNDTLTMSNILYIISQRTIFGGRLIFFLGLIFYGTTSKPDNDRHYAKKGVEDTFFV